MRRFNVLMSLLLLTPVFMVTAQPWEQVYPSWEVNTIHDILHWNGDTVFACGNEWTLLRSVDAGQTWQEMFHHTNGKNIDAMTTDGREIFFFVRTLTDGQYDMQHFPITAYNPYTGGLREIEMPTAVPPSLYSIYQLQATQGCLYVFDKQGTDSKIHRSTDGGATWSVEHLPKDALCSNWANTMHFVTDDIGFVICADTLDTVLRIMYRTEDGGKSWTKLSRKFSREDIKVAQVSDNGAIAVYMGLGLQVYVTTDSCKTWLEVGSIPWSSPTYPGVEAMDFEAGGVGFVAGEQSDIYATIDGGSTWAQVKEATALGGTIAIQILEEGVVLSGNLPGHFYRSENSGLTWSSLRMPLFHSIRGFVFRDALNGVLVAEDEAGLLYSYSSSDGGNTWKQKLFIKDFSQFDSVDVGVNYSVYPGGDTIQFYRQEYIGTGIRGSIHRLSEMGTKLVLLKVWDLGSAPEGTYSAFEGMHFVKGDSGTAYSYDDGKTWAFSVSTDTLNTKSEIQFTKDANGAVIAYCYNRYLVGTRYKKAVVYRSIDSCKTWDAILSPDAGYDAVYELDALGPDDVVVRLLGGTETAMLRTTDAGVHWTEIPTAPSLGLSETIYVGNFAYVLDGGFITVHKTTDYWKSEEIGFKYYGLTSGRLFFADENNGWIVANYVIYRTTNGGVNWIQQPFTVTESAAITDIYPNPVGAGQSAAVNLTLPVGTITGAHGGAPLQVSVYDLLGREVAVLYNGPADPGTRTLTWKPSATLPACMYMVRMTLGERVWAKQVAVLR